MTREQKMQKRREAGKCYTYKPISYPVDSKEYKHERLKRASKNISHKLPTANLRSVMAKLENELANELAKEHEKVRPGKKEKVA